jgi:hypothetical protein
MVNERTLVKEPRISAPPLPRLKQTLAIRL